MTSSIIFVPGTTTIDCCQTTPTGDVCASSSSPNTDTFGGMDPVETAFLVLSNLLLLLPAYKTFLMYNYTRTYITLSSMIFSSLYHLCKTSVKGGGICLLPFCTLKNLDYSFSTTVLSSILLLLFPFTAVSREYNNRNNEGVRGRWEDFAGVLETYILISTVFFLYITLGSTSLFCGGRNSSWLFGGVIVVTLLACLIGYVILRLLHLHKAYYENINKTNAIIAIVFAVLAVVCFLVEDYLPRSLYAVLHSFWHIFASLSYLYFLEIRNPHRTGLEVIFVCTCISQRINK